MAIFSLLVPFILNRNTMTLSYLYFCQSFFPAFSSSRPFPTDSLSSCLYCDYCSNFSHHQFSYGLWQVFKGCLLLCEDQAPLSASIPFSFKSWHEKKAFPFLFPQILYNCLVYRPLIWDVNATPFSDWSTQICMLYHFSNVIQNTISLGRNVTQNLVCLSYWLDHWAEAWFL